MLKSGAKITRFDEESWRLDNSVLAASLCIYRNSAAWLNFESTCVENLLPFQVSDRIARKPAGHVASGTRARPVICIISRL